MKRWTLRILFCLILGAITTVAVAWGIGATNQWESAASYYELDETSDGVPIQDFLIGLQADGNGVRTAHIASARLWSIAYVGDLDIDPDDLVGDRFAEGEPPDIHDYHINYHDYYSYSFGFPFVSMNGSILHSSSGTTPIFISDPVKLLVLEWNHVQRGRAQFSRPCRFLPLRPLWAGFVIDTLFYAAIWGGVWFGFAGGKRFIRSKRGRCPRCGYDLRGHRHEGTEARRHEGLAAGCPECGWNREATKGGQS